MGLKAGGPLFAVRDMKASLRFYQDVLGLEVVQDFGANVVIDRGTVPADPGDLGAVSGQSPR